MDPLDLTKYWSDSWRRYNLKGVCCCVDGDVASDCEHQVKSLAKTLTWGVWQEEQNMRDAFP